MPPRASKINPNAPQDLTNDSQMNQNCFTALPIYRKYKHIELVFASLSHSKPPVLQSTQPPNPPIFQAGPGGMRVAIKSAAPPGRRASGISLRACIYAVKAYSRAGNKRTGRENSQAWIWPRGPKISIKLS